MIQFIQKRQRYKDSEYISSHPEGGRAEEGQTVHVHK